MEVGIMKSHNFGKFEQNSTKGLGLKLKKIDFGKK